LRVKKKLMARPSTSVVAAEGTGVPKARAHTAPGGTSRCRRARNICGIIRAFALLWRDGEGREASSCRKWISDPLIYNVAALMELQPR